MMSSLITTSKWQHVVGGQHRHPHRNNIIAVVAIKIQNYQSHDIQWRSIPKMVSEKKNVPITSQILKNYFRRRIPMDGSGADDARE